MKEKEIFEKQKFATVIYVLLVHEFVPWLESRLISENVQNCICQHGGFFFGKL